MKDIIILYHADCPDGFGGAWAAHKKFGAQAEYIGVHHDTPPPTGLENKEIYMLDFTYDKPFTSKLIASNKRVTAIDHHSDQESITKSTQDYSFDNNHSGDTALHPGDMQKKWESFGWQTISIDGHNQKEIYRALTQKSDERPIAIIAETIKGNGLKIMENSPEWTHKYPSPEQLEKFITELT